MILLDTHVLLWLRKGSQRLGRRTREAVERAWAVDDLAVSAISFWEVGMLVHKGRIRLGQDAASWHRRQQQQGVVEIPVDGDIAIRAAALEGLHGDPADRIIVATAMEGHRLVTADQRILAWSGPAQRLDATL